MQAPGNLAFNRGAFKPQLTRHPQQLDLAPEIVDQLLVLARRPPLLFELGELAIDAPVDFEHRDPLCLGRVGGHGGTDTQCIEGGLDLLGRVAGGFYFAHDIGEGADHLVRAAHLLQLAT